MLSPLVFCPCIQHGFTPLKYAVEAGDVQVVSLLVDKGADVNETYKV